MDSDGEVMVVTMATISPSPEANSASRLALRGRTEGLRRLRGVDRKSGSLFRVSTPEGLYRRRGPRGGCQVSQEGACRAPPPGPRQPPSWVTGSGPGALLWFFPESSVEEIFNIIFLEFFGHFNPPENLKNKNSTGSFAENSVSPG